MSLVVDDVARWLVTPTADGGLGFRDTVAGGPKLPGKPDRIVVVTRYGGPGAIEENLFEVLAFQFRCRGGVRPGKSPTYRTGSISPDAGKDSYFDAEQLAITVDKALLDAPYPCYVNGKRVRSITGGPPQFLMTDSAQRVHFVANYLFTVAR